MNESIVFCDEVELRKITLMLLMELLWGNVTLKEKFCLMMGVHPAPGKVCTGLDVGGVVESSADKYS